MATARSFIQPLPNGGRRRFTRGVWEAAVVVTVTVEAAAVDPLTEGVAGEIEQVAREGASVQARETVPLKPRLPASASE